MLSSSKQHSWLIDLVFTTLLLGIFYALWIGGHALFTPDEGRYSEIAREMIVAQDYITPRLNGVAFLDKPVLYYWLQASAIKLFGLKEWALRFWPAFLGVFGCVMTYIAGRLAFNRRTGLLAAAILATSPLYYGAAHYANLDLEVAVLISTTLLFSLLALHNEKHRQIFFILAYVFCGLAALTKGLIGIVFPAMIIGFWILLLNRWAMVRQMKIITGLIIFFAITFPWYYAVQQANPQFLHFFFVTQQFSRFLTHGDFNNKTTVFFYVPIVLMGLFPWAVFVLQALGDAYKKVWNNRREHPIELFLLLWFTLIFIFFSIPKSKTIGYIIPIFPALALLIGNYLNNVIDSGITKGFRNGVIGFIACSIIIAITAVLAPHVNIFEIKTNTIPYLTFTTAIFLIAGFTTYKLLHQQRVRAIIYCLASIAIIGLLTLAVSLKVINEKSIKPIALSLKTQLIPDDEVVTYFKYYQDLPIYLERRITIVADWKDPGIINRDNWIRELWFGMPFQNTQDWLIDDATFWQRWNSNKRLFVLMQQDDFAAFAKKAKKRLRVLGERNEVVWVSNK